jgi:general secretion pathway protein E
MNGHEQELSETPAVIRYVADLLRRASADRASDLQLDPAEDGRGKVRMRVDGVLHPVEAPPPGIFQAVIAHLKTLGAMDVAERRLPQDGRCVGEDYSLRISTAPVQHGERACVCLYTRRPQDILLGLDTLGLDEADLAKVRQLAHLRAGLVIVNGPTGCGKTTLLYSMLLAIAKPEVNILTVEDPVELALPGVGQMGLRPDVGLTFPRAIRSMLRQAPNVIMVGEIRDLDTAELCHQASLTGHLVLTTLHANTSPEAVGRLLDLGIKPWLLSASLGGVVSMRLIRMLCPHCRKPAGPPTAQLPPDVRKFVESKNDAAFFAPVGCGKCGGLGFAGRTGIFEILMCEDCIRQAVSSGAGVPALREAAAGVGMRTMFMDGVQKAARGITTVEEVLRTVPVQDWQ